ncbi:MAG: orotate phosphoribosyltransferase [Omnitrophica WOR_2 bacterium GWF2_38_59]|nr:MAG: orotate phosphoribosyltransferase [Omnitrophica WOR_2 bacterium GWF2_38_59]OGX49792.1 MAG: orotate phosphoribosyltransferase [Omnitrophica WOR_2 bacterium RIFOXYA2_FULL_38_17]OGX54592.1 MAG: orotate phosphoribosyltransferase [Omnitrophica WOR_2 bacterium RIFOXYA12_FULL_38_10]OGX58302.1 MAG: orotate phosphoribosyltransferase [Omnitrophica WOR_2 bacterium RIFOXYB2_FULL_38_16]OGX58486.1 MAG: orotate phosphoribosyltransferase [Omnitrophica WOR_2 bacterium RIFOXYC2_FULL_38_12]
MSGLLQCRKKLLDIIINNAYFKEKIILSSGKESDYYIDARLVTLSPEGVYLCAKLILDIVKEDDLDAIGGPTLGADPMVGAIGVLSYQEGNPVNTFIIRKAPKAHGKQQQIEGPVLNKGSKIVLIDDVATTGKAFLESLDVLDKMGISVKKAICVVDRREGAKEALAKRGCELISLFDISEIHKK